MTVSITPLNNDTLSLSLVQQSVFFFVFFKKLNNRLSGHHLTRPQSKNLWQNLKPCCSVMLTMQLDRALGLLQRTMRENCGIQTYNAKAVNDTKCASTAY